MSPKVDLSKHTQARAYQAGYQDALEMLVDALIEGGDVSYLIDALEDNAKDSTKAKLNTHYANKG